MKRVYTGGINLRYKTYSLILSVETIYNPLIR